MGEIDRYAFARALRPLDISDKLYKILPQRRIAEYELQTHLPTFAERRIFGHASSICLRLGFAGRPLQTKERLGGTEPLVARRFCPSADTFRQELERDLISQMKFDRPSLRFIRWLRIQAGHSDRTCGRHLDRVVRHAEIDLS